ncbi:adenylate kinase [Flavobacterium sp. HJSW_4]|uniref:ATP-binding protein n=1 Tax=Flavobacterium sp. HJSW_4 TaxID=3344660 RepID=UPI0035F4A973
MKIHIFGASGSGVTTTGKALAEKMHFEYLDSDDYFWETTGVPFTLKRDPEVRNSKIKSDLESLGNWILGGSIFEWGENVFPDFDLVVFLWIPSQIRMERLKKREFERYGNVIYNDPERIQQFENFIKWAEDYDNNTGIASRNFEAHKKWLASINFDVLEISGDLTLEQRIDIILNKIKNLNK